jgi:hypothetical protein
MEGHDHGYPMIVAVAFSSSASYTVMMGGFFLFWW